MQGIRVLKTNRKKFDFHDPYEKNVDLNDKGLNLIDSLIFEIILRDSK